MRQEESDAKNVYGENHDSKEAEGENTRGIRERVAEIDPDKRVAEALDDVREQMVSEQPTQGGMGREGSPNDGPSQGQIHRDEEEG